MTPAEFHAALQQWAQAEWNRRHGGADAADIRRLLRDHYTHRIGEGDDGIAIPGEYRVRRRGTSAMPYIPPDIGPESWTWMMEHGLLTVDLSDLIASPAGYVARLWVQSATGAYYAGTGTLIPDSDPERHRYPVGTLLSDPELTPDTDWPDAPPTVASGWHETIYGAGASAIDHLVVPRQEGGYEHAAIYPERYTGLARAWAQAWLGAGLTATDVAKLLPDGWDIAPGTLGLMRDPAENGAYWALQASITGLVGVSMAPVTNVGTVVQGWVDDGNLTGLAADLAASYPMAALKASGLPVTLITAEEMAPIYAGQGETIPDTAETLIDDGVPDGGSSGDYYDAFSWTTDRAKSGTKSHRTSTSYGQQWHWIAGPSGGLSGELPSMGTLTCWVWMESGKDLPLEIGLAFLCVGESIYRYAHWGDTYFPSAFTSYYPQGDVPDARGQWVQLVVAVNELGISGKKIARIYFVSTMGSNRGYIDWDLAEAWTPGTSYGEGDAWSDQGGWLWANTIAAGAIVNRRVVDPGLLREASETRQARVDITWTDGVPSATLSPGTWAKFRPYWAYYKLWYGIDGSSLNLLRHGQIYPGDSDCAETAPVLVCWDDADSKTLSYYRTVIIGAGTYNESGGLDSCYGGGTETVVSGDLQRMVGGYGWDGPPPALYIGDGTVRVRTWNITAGEEPSNLPLPNSTSYFPNVQNFWASVACVIINPESWYPSGYQEWVDGLNEQCGGYSGGWAFYTRSGVYVSVEYLSTYVDAGGTGGQLLAYLSGVPDLLWELQGQPCGEGSTRRNREWTDDDAEYSRRVAYIAYDAAHNPAVCPDQFLETVAEGAIGKTWTTTDQATGDETINLDGTESTEICYRNGSPIYTSDTDQTGWGPLGGNGSEPAQIDLSGQASAGGVLIYTPSPGDTLEWDGWTGEAPDGDLKAFVGSV